MTPSAPWSHGSASAGDPALRERPLEQRLVVEGEDVEGHERGRRLLGQHRHARRRGVDALLERLEVLAALGGADDELAVQHVAAMWEAELGKVAAEPLAVSRLDVDVVAVHERDGPKAVPLRLEEPAVTIG